MNHTTRRFIRHAPLVALLLGGGLRAQDTTRLPAIVVRMTPIKPGARTLVGVVHDTGSFAVDSVEITIAGIKRRTFSGRDGQFRFDDIGPGSYVVRARRIGWGPQVRMFVVDSGGGTGSFELLPLTHTLAPVIVNSARRGLSGVVGDSSYHQIVGAEVHLMGHSQTTHTDSAGEFFIDVDEGHYMLNIARDGFAPRLMSVNIPKDSGRRITVILGPQRAENKMQAFNVTDLSARLAWQNRGASRFYTREDLIQRGYEWVWDAVFTGAASAGLGVVPESECWAVENGGPGAVPLANLTVDDIESIEIGPAVSGAAARAAGRGVASGRGSARFRPSETQGQVPARNYNLARVNNQGMRCPLTIVWLRDWR